jgi:thioredoxin 1
VRDVTDDGFAEEVLNAGKPVVVDFWAPWCGPCRAVHPILEQLAEETNAVEFVKLDIDANPVNASRYDVLSIPTVILFAEGMPQEIVVGARPAKHFREKFARYLEAAPAGAD